MRILRTSKVSAGLLLLTLPVLAAPPKDTTIKHRRHATMRSAGTTGKKGTRSANHTSAVAIPPERATAIQSALIKQGYLSGEPTGAWDSQTVSAMEKLQADNGWQSRITPDSRALIKLGLGPHSDAEDIHEGLQSSPR